MKPSAIGQPRAVPLERGIAPLDSGTTESLLESVNLIPMTEQGQGLTIACLEEIALARGLITAERLERSVAETPRSPYGTAPQRC